MVALKDGDFHIIKHYDSAVGHLYTVLIGRAGRGKYKEAYECYTYHLIRLLDVDYTEVEDGE
jgi:hypothetical protein